MDPNSSSSPSPIPQTKSITLSPYTDALVKDIQTIKKSPLVDESSKINVSQTVSFFAIIYEKLRNAVEYREDHLIRRAAIERILKRRLLLNPEGKGEGENIIRELLWARYFVEGSLGFAHVESIQKLVNLYVTIRKKLITGHVGERKVYLSQCLMDLVTCEIEETLAVDESKRNSLFTYFMYQVLRKKVKIEKMKDTDKDAYFYVAVEKGYTKSDTAYLRYHLFALSHTRLLAIGETDVDQFISDFPGLMTRIDRVVAGAYVERLTRYVRQQLPPFSILFSTIKRNVSSITSVLTDKTLLWNQVDQMCREKYALTSVRLRTVAIRSLIYIFLTKMIFAIALEVPLSQLIYHEVNTTSIIINSLFPPFIMLFIIGLVRIPGEDNTKKIYDRIVNLIDNDTSFENTLTYTLRPPRVRKPMLIFGFTVFYSLTFVITLGIIYMLLSLLDFNLISDAVFIFFVSVVSFFGYRVTQIAKEYKLQEKSSFFSPFVDFFFMPILSLGKLFNTGIRQLNFFIFIFDFLIEAPFKLIFEVVEEWISFVRARKDEIV